MSITKIRFAVLFGLCFLVVSAASADSLKVKTDMGQLVGSVSGAGQVRAYLGIPYAAPPVGALRWKAPQPAEKWHGVKAATAFGSRCMQPTVYADMVFRDPGQSEDCLTLNVWTPAVNKNARLPVMVWIHGGGFTTGASSEPRQDGERLAQKGVLVVSMNYRLGIFGFFAHHELAAENQQHAAGNYGLLDQAAALAWVKRNIAAFGGDPRNVTIFGESAGSFSVSAQMASPLSRDLFVHAIGESGGAFGRIGLAFLPLEKAEQVYEEFATKAFGTADLASLRAVNAQLLLATATAKDSGAPHTSPDIDGYFFPESVGAIYAEGHQAHIPLLAGWNKDEATSTVLKADQKPTVQIFQALAQKEYGKSAPYFLNAYAAADDDEALRAAEDYAGDQFIAFSTWAWLEAQVLTGGAPVFRYRFDRASPGDPNHPVSAGAFHSDDIEYVFGNLNSRSGAKWAPEDYQLSELMQSYWTNFAKTGDPNGQGLPSWPAYQSEGGWQILVLDATSASEADRHRDRDLFLQNWLK